MWWCFLARDTGVRAPLKLCKLAAAEQRPVRPGTTRGMLTRKRDVSDDHAGMGTGGAAVATRWLHDGYPATGSGVSQQTGDVPLDAFAVPSVGFAAAAWSTVSRANERGWKTGACWKTGASI